MKEGKGRDSPKARDFPSLMTCLLTIPLVTKYVK